MKTPAQNHFPHDVIISGAGLCGLFLAPWTEVSGQMRRIEMGKGQQSRTSLFKQLPSSHVVASPPTITLLLSWIAQWTWDT